MGLKTLAMRESARTLARLGGIEKELEPVRGARELRGVLRGLDVESARDREERV
jgi:hypothetical protein